MAFGKTQDEERKEYRSLISLSYHELTDKLASMAQMIRFEGTSTVPSVSKNCSVIAMWADMNADTFREKMNEAKRSGKSIEEYSGATRNGSVVAPANSKGEYLVPMLYDVIQVQKERVARIDYANNKSSDLEF